MNNYKLIISYDGTEYQGWQQQRNKITIADTLEKTFFKVFHLKVTVIGASRTDAGVHAIGQTALIRTTLDLDCLILKNIWNDCLPKDIVITNIFKVDNDFHPMMNVKNKIYHYNFFLERPSPFLQRYGWYFEWPLNIEKLKENLNVFIGTHDFRSFCSGHEMKSTVRTINEINLLELNNNTYTIEIKAKSFLKYMIRRIVGASIDVASRKSLSTDYLTEVLNKKNANHTLQKAPSKGLILQQIEYEEL